MTSATTNNRSPLSRKKIQQLLAAVGSKPAKDASQAEATEYDWHKPHHFSNGQLKKLGYFAEKVAAAIAKRFSALYHSEFEVTVVSTTQLFAYEFLEQVTSGQQSNYYQAFAASRQESALIQNEKDFNPGGLVGIPPQTAVAWVTPLLGEGEGESEKQSDRALSQLEESLLSDIASTIVNAFSSSHEDYDFHPAGSIVKGQVPLKLHGSEELCRITFNTKKAETENGLEAELFVLSDKLDPVAGKGLQAGNEFSADDVSKAMLEHLHRMPVSVIGQLASTYLTFEQIMDLRPYDVLLLDKRINEPVELIVEGRVLLRGQPAKSAGKYAVLITESPFCGLGRNKSQNKNANPK